MFYYLKKHPPPTPPVLASVYQLEQDFEDDAGEKLDSKEE